MFSEAHIELSLRHQWQRVRLQMPAALPLEFQMQTHLLLLTWLLLEYHWQSDQQAWRQRFQGGSVSGDALWQRWRMLHAAQLSPLARMCQQRM